MTYYHGGKKRIGKKISNIIIQLINKSEKNIIGYCEPFCGMCGVYKHIRLNTNFNNYLAGDINESLIIMWNSLQHGWIPPRTCSKELFMDLKNKQPSSEKGFMGHAWGFRGIFCNSYANRPQKHIDLQVEACKLISKILKDVKFSNCSFSEYSNLKNFIIYCDPPYKKQSIYYNDNSNLVIFDHNVFWEWVRKMSIDNIVLVSEYEAPDDMICIWTYGNEKIFTIKK